MIRNVKSASRGLLAGLVLGGLVLMGGACSKQGQKAEKESAAPAQEGSVGSAAEKTIAQMAPADVIVSVNGVALTKAQFEAGIKQVIQRMAQASGAKGKQAATMARMAVKMYVPRFVSTQLMVQEAKRQKVLDEAGLKKEVESCLVRAAKKSGKKTVAELLELAPGGGESLRREAEEMVLVDALLNSNVWPQVVVSDKLVAAARETLMGEGQSIAATNAVRIARLNEIRKEILAGADFGKLADRYSQCTRSGPGNNGYWSRFEPNEFPDLKMRTAIFALKPGEVSEVLENEEGFHLVKMLKRYPPVKNEKGVVTQNETVELAHILLRRAPVMDPALLGDLKGQLVQQLRQQKLDEYIDSLKTNAVIVYPHGTNLWEKSPAQPAK